MASKKEEGEWPHHQILRVHRQFAFRQHLCIQKAIPYLAQRKVIPRFLKEKITEFPENDDDNINFLLGFLRDAEAECFVRFIEALGDSTLPEHGDDKLRKSHSILIDTMSKELVKISNANIEQVRRVRAVVDMVLQSEDKTPVVEQQSEIEQPVVDPGLLEKLNIESEESDKSKVITTSSPTEQTKKTKVTLPYPFPLQPGFVKPGIARLFQRSDTGNSWILTDSTHGIKIDIPFDSVPDDIKMFAIIGHAYLNGNFHIPPEYEICTSIFTLKTYPDFKFVNPVLLSLPHANTIFELDEEDDDLVVLRAEVLIDDDNLTCAYHFKDDIISDVHYSEDSNYMIVEVDHFSAVAGAKRRKQRRTSRHPLATRQNSTSRQRRKMKLALKNRIKKAGSGDSSRQSSYESSFEKDTSAQKCESSFSGCSEQPQSLHRQGAIDEPLLRQTSSEEECTVSSTTEVLIYHVYPVHCRTSWINKFIVVPNHPTGTKAAYDVISMYKKKLGSVEQEKQLAVPTKRFIEFMPEKWKSQFWIVGATSTPIIPLGLVGDIRWTGDVTGIEFKVESTNRPNAPQLRQEITVNGVQIFGKELFFTIQSSVNSGGNVQCDIEIKSWLFSEDSKLIHALSHWEDNKDEESDENNIVLNPAHIATKPDDEKQLKIDISKLIAEIAFQISDSTFLEHVAAEGQRITDTSDHTECAYLTILSWINGRRRPHLIELKQLLQNSGLKLFVSSNNQPKLITGTSGLEDQKQCDYDSKSFATLAGLLNTQHWKFIGRYLGLADDYDGDFSYIAKEDVPEAVIQILLRWKKMFGPSATTAVLLKALTRVNELSPYSIQAAVSYVENTIIRNEYKRDE